SEGEALQSVRWSDDAVLLLDQRLLPEQIEFLRLTTPQDIWEAIRELKVRGAPAIGIAAAYGIALGLQNAARAAAVAEDWLSGVESDAAYLATSRPTAVNLFWALDRMKACAEQLRAAGRSAAEAHGALLAEARRIQSEDEETNRRIG